MLLRLFNKLVQVKPHGFSQKCIGNTQSLRSFKTEATRCTAQALSNTSGQEKLVVIDTDAGTDDAHAIFMALRAHRDPEINFRVVGIMAVNGNTGVDNVCRNVRRILNTASVNDVPVFRGAGRPIVRKYEHKEDPPYHGYDGFGDVFPNSDIDQKIETEHGVNALIRLAHEHKEKLSILALGPLTNLAMAARLEPSIGGLIKEVCAMGGNMEGVGNTTVSAEFNFAVDPEAAFIALSSYECRFRIVPWEVCLRQATPYSWRVNEIGGLNSPAAELLNKIENNLLVGAKASGRWIPCDQIAAAMMIQPQVVSEERDFHCTVELDGTHTRGQMVVDHAAVLCQPNNVSLVTRVDQEMLRKLLIWGLEPQQSSA